MPNIESINKKLLEAISVLDSAAAEIGEIRLEPKGTNLASIGSALAEISQIQYRIYQERPDLQPVEPERQPDPDLTDEQRANVRALSSDAINKIDELLLSYASVQWRKVARIVGGALADEGFTFKGIPDIYLSQRVGALVESRKLESQGNLQFMRYSEVRLPSAKT